MPTMAVPTLTLASEASDKHFMYLVRGVIGKIVQHHPDATLAALRGLLDESGLDSAGARQLQCTWHAIPADVATAAHRPLKVRRERRLAVVVGTCAVTGRCREMGR